MSEQLQRYVEHVMGMPISLALRGRHAADLDGRDAWAEALAALRDVDRVFSSYRQDSVVSRLGRGEIDLADCPTEVIEVLDLGARAERESGGAFRVRLPARDGRTRLDPSGVVKGWAVERAARPLRALEATDFCLSAGGDMVCRTIDPGAAPWRIGIEDPHDPTRVLAVVPVHNGAVATSGTAHRGSHLLDGRTGRPPEGVASVTVVAESLTWADIDATAAYALGPDAARWLRTRPGRRGLVVGTDGSTTLVTDDLVSDPWDASGSASPAGPTPAGAATSTRAASRSASSWATPPSG
ncbi:FAD:protein FMN transferase [Nocardioides koreensis]|uniref:FAD:protein FMN transferase n=1 Tax=Nocardioides koreensis TaxID=433651 RepID=A0ABN3A8L9_9ACTN